MAERERLVYVYRLHVEWPAEALLPDGTLNSAWRPEGWKKLMTSHPQLARVIPDDYEQQWTTEFRLPTARNYLTREAAIARLKPFRAIGCIAWAERSKPVEWPDGT